MSSPRHSPPPSAAAPKPKGILKNAGSRRPSQGEGLSAQDDEAARLQWDETNLTLHEIEREQQEARMKIDEPKTPFVHGTSLDPVGDEDFFNLDGGSAPSASSGRSRSGSAADQLAANTSANSGRAPGEGHGLAVGLDAADLAKSSSASGSASDADVRPLSARSTSRSPSFSLPPKSPSSRRSSSRSATAAADDGRGDVRAQANEMDVDEADDGEIEEEDADPETQAKHAEFAAKRNQHYGNEAEAMKIAAALAAQDDDEDEDDEDEEMAEAVPTRPNGTAAAR